MVGYPYDDATMAICSRAATAASVALDNVTNALRALETREMQAKIEAWCAQYAEALKAISRMPEPAEKVNNPRACLKLNPVHAPDIKARSVNCGRGVTIPLARANSRFKRI